MALQVWLPFNNNLTNQGLRTITSTAPSGITYSSGKLGQCLSASSNVSVTLTVPNLSTMLANGKTYSLSCWVKLTDSVTSGWVVKLGTNTCGLWWAKSAPRWVWNENDNGKRCANETLAMDLNWHHLTITVDKTVTNQITTKQYVDGALDTVYPGSTWDCSSHSQPAGDTITISPYVANLNDLRIYDHVLSPREVKEIAKGLALHWACNRFGYSNPNLVPNYGNYSSESSAYAYTTNKVDGWYFLAGSHFICEPSTTYTFSVCCDGTLASGHGTSANPSVKSFTMWLYLCNSDTTKDYNNGGYDSPVNFNSSNYSHQQIGNKHIWKYTTTATQTHMSV